MSIEFTERTRGIRNKLLIAVGILMLLFAVLVALLGKPSVGDIVTAKVSGGSGCVSRDALVRFEGFVDAHQTETLNKELMFPRLCLKFRPGALMTVVAKDGDYIVVRREDNSTLWTYWAYVSFKGYAKQ